MSAKIAVLVRQFPKISESFIVGEISNLADMGMNVRIVSLHRPNAEIQQPGASRLQDRVTYIDEAPRAAAFITLVLALFRKPALLVAVLKDVHAHYISEPALLADLAGNRDHD